MSSKLKAPHLVTSTPPSDLDPAFSAATGSRGSSDMLLGQRLQELSATASASTSSGSGRGERSRAASFLAVLDAVFLNLRFDALESHRHFPFHFATYQIGHQVRCVGVKCLGVGLWRVCV